jgi:hypothetical protein
MSDRTTAKVILDNAVSLCYTGGIITAMRGADMPLSTQIRRNGEPIPVRWSDFHVAAMALAAAFDQGTAFLGDPRDIYETDALPNEMFDCYPDAPFPITKRIAFEIASYPVLARTPLNSGSYTLTRKHKFIDHTDGEVLELHPGDELIAYRSM